MKKVNLRKEVKEKIESLGINKILIDAFSKKLNISSEDFKNILNSSFDKSIDRFESKMKANLKNDFKKPLSEISTEDLLKDENITKG